jgi:hypothetical protein
MNLFKRIFGKKETPIKSYQDFWAWFQENEQAFFKVVKNRVNIEEAFFEKLSSKLGEIKEGYFFLTGMFDENTAELILTADGNVKNIVFVEELVAAAPIIQGWKFTALKPPSENGDFIINMGNYEYSTENIFFYSNDNPDMPDEIDISVVYQNFQEKDKDAIANGVFIFLDNFIGELNLVTIIDNINVIGKGEAKEALIPIEKLKDFLVWRQKEFLEKYEGVRFDTDNDNYAAMEGELKNGDPIIAIVNTSLLDWDAKASHPWLLAVEIKYDGKKNNGLPEKEAMHLLDKIEEDISGELKDYDGFLSIGRQTGGNLRTIYFACKDFRKPSKVLHEVVAKHGSKHELEFDIYKDKYWQSFNRFRPVL